MGVGNWLFDDDPPKAPVWYDEPKAKPLPEERPEYLRWVGSSYGGTTVVTVTTWGKVIVDPDLYRVLHPRARKRHKCCECGRKIQKGEQYQLVEGLWDGDSWCRFKTCAECEDMRQGAWRDYQDGIPFGDLHSQLAEDVEDALGDTFEAKDARYRERLKR